MKKIEHFIVLVMENRSFDHMLGYLDHPSPTFKGVGKTQNPITTKNARYGIYPGPGHSHSDAMEQILGLTADKLPSYPNETYTPTMSGFAANYERYAPGAGSKVLRCFDPKMVPVLSTLALEYAVCDQWFCSLPGETFPNRDFLHTGCSLGNVEVKIDSVTAPTVFKMLDDVNKTWRVYHHHEAHLLLYRYVRNQGTRIKGHDDLVKDIRGNRLANYSFVEPDYGIVEGRGNSQHPSQARSREEFVDGEAFIARIYNALRETPQVFEKTAFIITYDEHGGFYDHVPPPRALEPDPQAPYKSADGKYTFGFRLLGPRVPAVIISPWIKRHTVDSRIHDHSSIPETLRRRFAPNKPALTRRQGNHIDKLFSLPKPRRGSELPVVQALSHDEARDLENKLSAPADASDNSPKLDYALQNNLKKAAEWLKQNIGGTDLPFGI